jgi:hypothetical protein
MRLVVIVSIVIAGLATSGSASVHVRAADRAHADYVKQSFARELASAKLSGATYDLAVRETVSPLSSRQIEVTIELRIAISDRTGRMISFARASANASGSQKAIASLRAQATTDAIEAAVERVRTAR